MARTHGTTVEPTGQPAIICFWRVAEDEPSRPIDITHDSRTHVLGKARHNAKIASINATTEFDRKKDV